MKSDTFTCLPRSSAAAFKGRKINTLCLISDGDQRYVSAQAILFVIIDGRCGEDDETAPLNSERDTNTETELEMEPIMLKS